MKKLAFIFSVLLVAVYFANLMYTDSKEAKIKLEQMLRKTTVDKAMVTGDFRSTVSQEDANNKAKAAVEAQGQSTAPGNCDISSCL